MEKALTFIRIVNVINFVNELQETATSLNFGAVMPSSSPHSPYFPSPSKMGVAKKCDVPTAFYSWLATG